MTAGLELRPCPFDDSMHSFTFKDVLGIVDSSGTGGACIYEFSSRNPGKGEAREALQALRAKLGPLSVTDIGAEDDPSYKFWMHVLNQNLVDVVYDEEGKAHRSPSQEAAAAGRGARAEQ